MTSLENDEQYIAAVESITTEMRAIMDSTISPDRLLELAEKLVEAKEAWYDLNQEFLEAKWYDVHREALESV